MPQSKFTTLEYCLRMLICLQLCIAATTLKKARRQILKKAPEMESRGGEVVTQGRPVMWETQKVRRSDSASLADAAEFNRIVGAAQHIAATA